MSQQLKIKVRITDSQPKSIYPSVKQIRKLCKEEAELKKLWPEDAILKWDDHQQQCEFCGKFYSNLSNLRRHFNTHNKESLACLFCPECVKPFYRTDHLSRHLKENCHIIKGRKSTGRAPTFPAIQAANEVILMASQTKKRKTPEWAMIPIDTDIDSSKPRRRRTLMKKKTVPIPLSSKAKLPDPRGSMSTVSSPITDEDAALVEMMLEDLPSPRSKSAEDQEDLTHIPLCSKVTVPEPRGRMCNMTPITDEDAALVEMMLDDLPQLISPVTDKVEDLTHIKASTPEERGRACTEMITHEDEDAEPSAEIVAFPQGTHIQTLSNQGRVLFTNLNELIDVEVRTDVQPPTNKPPTHLYEDPWKSNPESTKEERKIPLETELPPFITTVTDRPPPPWEMKPKMIQHNGEDYIVLDELVGAVTGY